MKSMSQMSCFVMPKIYHLGVIGATTFFAACTPNSHSNNLEDKPNVIIILSDDQGYGDFSCHGNPVLETPALDQLYKESIRFERFHVAPLCTPTRGQMLTGLDAFNNKAATVLTARNLMRRDLVTMPEIFAQNGYVTGIFGKWHLGDTYPDRPMDRGFQKCLWTKGWGLLSEIEYDNDYYETRYLDSLDIKYSGEYCTNLWFNKSMEWMEDMANQGKPFFTFLSLNVPHGPFNSQHQDFNFYKDKVEDERTASFLGMLRNVDRNMERLESWLEKNGLKDNTILIYLTDNGGTGGVDLYNAGMRGRKGSNYEGGHRAAIFIRHPNGDLVSPQTIHCPAHIQDLLPTFIDLLHLDGTPTYPFDGVSLRPAIVDGKKLEDRKFVIQYGGHVKPEKYFSCVVWKNWRLIGDSELYDLTTDPGQVINLANEYPEVMNDMQAFYESWWDSKEPGLNDFVPVIVGSDYENPVIITSHNWEFGAVNSQWNIAMATGPVDGGVSHVEILQSGRYRIELARWPFHLNRDLTSRGPGSAVGGTILRPGRALPIEYGCMMINEQLLLKEERSYRDTKITFEMDLVEGNKTIRGWFQDSQGNDLCGAYYIRVKRL